MGDLVKIYDVARELVLLAGKEPHKDIEIKFTGLRPGEKIIEELWEDSEDCKEDFNENLYIIRNGAISDLDSYNKHVNKVITNTRSLYSNSKQLKKRLEEIVIAS
jgi:FlaA1/EpsC-like NDP-sugar epimerase